MYLQNIYVVKHLYLQYVKKSDYSLLKGETTQLDNGQKILTDTSTKIIQVASITEKDGQYQNCSENTNQNYKISLYTY